MEILHKTRKLGDRLGAGLITGAADDDPSGIATYSQGGAQFGGGLLWTLVLTTPLMIGIQMVSARLGWITGKGLAANIQQVMPRWVGIVLVALLVFANTLNIAADIAAMGEALQLIVGGGEHGHALVFGVICAVLPLWLNFDAMVRVLKWLTLALFAYVAVALMMQVDWHTVGVESVSALRTGGGDYWMMVVAVLGTTISPYLFFWQAAQEAEMRQRNADSEEVVNSPLFTREHLFRIKLDTVIGMGFSNVIAFCIMLAAAMAFHQHGITDIQTSRQAALALEPIAGHFAFLLFALGVIGTGMLAVPVLAGSAAYAVAEVLNWKAGLDHHYTEAKGFYSVLVAATVIGTLMDFTNLDPIRALVWSAVVNGVIAVPIMVVMMLLGSNRAVLGDAVLTPRHRLLGWAAVGVMAVAVVAMVLG
ncbi:NRAMP family divalent metal transporter [Brachymonas denitrificans]|jgi:Mn2+/Fe2+ NRAMP family transporter|uniref:Mn2+ and Fe2+ transporters of the NRAMP family n=1 Tax=Brachymonas denitrificans DSM 15123 TaxID=1121117 RepID=A0A1H8EHG4_9BURK|nr:divalent metal cation transporter [Brachymonas denitrificans]SEN18564.1 Mn2+ and Fe2+ transporters of the NRAMP family [Brachymonas denitrificans DSM 15123]